MRKLSILSLALCACAFDVPSEPPSKLAPYCEMGPVESYSELATKLAAIPTRETPLVGYNRYKWRRWSDFDGDCQDTRAEILIESSNSAILFADPSRPCIVVQGLWNDTYTLATYTSASDIDIDHVIPLRTMFELVGHNPTDKWEALELELSFIEHGNLLPVQDSANRSKGARGPARWLPEPVSARCTYIRKYGHLLAGYTQCYQGPAFTSDDRATMVHQSELCAAGGVPGAPQVEGSADVPPPNTCCKVCRASKACGDSCISRSKVCTKSAGCACRGG